MKNNVELKIFGRCRAGLLAAAVVLCMLPASSFGLALFNDPLPGSIWTDQEFPNLNNNVVRIYDSFGANAGTASTGFGTGTIISVVPDGGGGDYYNVLTADHVVYSGVNSVNNGNYGSIGIGFGTSAGFAVGANYPLTVSSLVNNVQLDGANNGPDLAVFSVDVSAAQLAAAAGGPNGISAPGTGANSLALSVPIAAPAAGNGNQIIQVGYGSQATVGFGAPAPGGVPGTPRYLATQDFGTYNSGGNTITALVGGFVGTGLNPRGGASANYTFDAVRGTYVFGIQNPGAANATITTGTTYILSGDSGGPTFQLMDGVYQLIGVHSASQGFNINTPNEYETQGQLWSDVQLSSYQNWISQAVTAVDVPEPSTLALAGVGGLLCLLRCGRRVATLCRVTHF